MNEWQPIETAPKDGTRFWAYEKRGDYCHYECWWKSDFVNWEGWQDDWDCEPSPTHWMPLPPPPVSSEGDEWMEDNQTPARRNRG